MGQHLADRDATGALNVDVRPARVDEAQLLSALALRSKAHWGYTSEFIEACRTELTISADNIRSAAMRYFVLERGNRVVGFYALSVLTPTEIELDALFVEPADIGAGFGRALIEHAQRTASALGARRLVIQSDPNAARFYQAAGGRQTGESESASVPGRYLPTFEITLAEHGESGG